MLHNVVLPSNLWSNTIHRFFRSQVWTTMTDSLEWDVHQCWTPALAGKINWHHSVGWPDVLKKFYSTTRNNAESRCWVRSTSLFTILQQSRTRQCWIMSNPFVRDLRLHAQLINTRFKNWQPRLSHPKINMKFECRLFLWVVDEDIWNIFALQFWLWII